MNRPDNVIIIGAGLAGLSCARHLQRAGVTVQILEASDGVGGRVRTDIVEGFRLDRGFQVLLTAYPEVKRELNYSALDLRPFYPGALVRVAGKFHRVADPFRRPLDAVSGLFSPVGTFSDKFRVRALRAAARAGTVGDLFRRPQTTTLEKLRAAGCTDSIIERFFRPFLGGVFLERELRTSSRMFEFVFRMFAEGDTAIPANGMGELPRQLAATLPAGSIRLKSPVQSITGNEITLAGGEKPAGRAVVVATEGPVAMQLLGEPKPVGSREVTCLYFAAEKPPIAEPILVLNGDGSGPVNNVCVLSNVSPAVAPAGMALVSVSVLGPVKSEMDVRKQLREWFGDEVSRWRHLRSYHIAHALPELDLPTLKNPERPVQVRPGLYVCGDHRDNASINGAMVSGRRAAEAVLQELR